MKGTRSFRFGWHCKATGWRNHSHSNGTQWRSVKEDLKGEQTWVYPGRWRAEGLNQKAATHLEYPNSAPLCLARRHSSAGLQLTHPSSDKANSPRSAKSSPRTFLYLLVNSPGKSPGEKLNERTDVAENYNVIMWKIYLYLETVISRTDSRVNTSLRQSSIQDTINCN